MLTPTSILLFEVRVHEITRALVGVTVALAPSADRYVTDRIEIRPQHFRIAKNLNNNNDNNSHESMLILDLARS